MKGKLQDEMIRLCTDIITSRDEADIPLLYTRAKDLYEKLAVLKFIEEKLGDIEIDVSKNAVASKFELLANAVLSGNTAVPENNPHDEDIITPGMDTIKGFVSEMPKVDDMLSEFAAEPNFMKNDKELFEPQLPKNPAPETLENPGPKSLNDRLTKELKVDLNDRLAFVKHLFNGSTEDFNRVISQLNTIDSEERSIAFLDNMVKPDYNQWQGKEEYESRLLSLINRKFS
ncbi:hypothetical protein [Sediminicola luteus]|uniref:Uncharacterized protein n=1 Tax=Sediminicola luteus TaxID=319238 RepID=A0A2A4G3S3_9FLAO|nr:hypothetical protein [Sediminicola luteus]PCE63073.1 hypothetical protein B7P33_17530 [Sediminicola luteus]